MEKRDKRKGRPFFLSFYFLHLEDGFPFFADTVRLNGGVENAVVSRDYFIFPLNTRRWWVEKHCK